MHCIKHLRILITVAVCFAADPLDDIVARAPGAPPELAADLLLRTGKPAVLDDAFTYAGSNLILQEWAVRSMVRADMKRALALFPRIQLPAKPPGCEDERVSSYNNYYELAGVLYQSAFTKDARQEGRDLTFLDDLVRTMTSPLQVNGVATLIRNKPGFPRLVSSFAFLLRQVNGSARAFREASPQDMILRLIEDSSAQRISPFPLADAYRAYLIRHLQGPRCGDDDSNKRAAALVSDFNKRLVAYGVGEISAEEAKPSRLEAKTELKDPWTGSIPGRLILQQAELRFGSIQEIARRKTSIRTLPEDDRRREEWETKVRKHLALLAQWQKETTETQEHVLQVSSRIYDGLFDIVPEGPLFDDILQVALQNMKDSPVRTQSPLVWRDAWLSLLRGTHKDRVRSAAANSGDWVMAAYAELVKEGK